MPTWGSVPEPSENDSFIEDLTNTEPESPEIESMILDEEAQKFMADKAANINFLLAGVFFAADDGNITMLAVSCAALMAYGFNKGREFEKNSQQENE